MDVCNTPRTGTDSSADPNPAPVINVPAAAGLSAADLQTIFAVDAAATALTQAAVYPQSVASGDPRPLGIVLWTRIAPGSEGGAYGDLVGWQIASDSGFEPASILASGVATVNPASDNTVKLPISVSVLQPYTGYFYRFIYNQVASRTGRFRRCRPPMPTWLSSTLPMWSARTTATATTPRWRIWRSKKWTT